MFRLTRVIFKLELHYFTKLLCSFWDPRRLHVFYIRVIIGGCSKRHCYSITLITLDVFSVCMNRGFWFGVSGASARLVCVGPLQVFCLQCVWSTVCVYMDWFTHCKQKTCCGPTHTSRADAHSTPNQKPLSIHTENTSRVISIIL
jgi:hypothetical protein